ncbi:hypothetical protein AB7M11_000561 [Bradyrhizobium ottawaense]
MPLRIAAQHVCACTQQATESHAAFVALDLLCVGRRHRRDAIGELQARLQKADAAEIFDLIDVERVPGQADRTDQLGSELALIGHVMDGHHGAGSRAIVIVQIGRREPGLPVMGVHDIGYEGGDEAVADIGGDARQCREAHAIVRPVDTLCGDIGIARPRIEMWHVEHEQVEPVVGAREQPARSAEIIRPAPDFLCVRYDPRHVGITRHQGAHLDAMRLQRNRQRAGDIREAAGLDDGIDFRSDREDANRPHVLSLSIIG